MEDSHDESETESKKEHEEEEDYSKLLKDLDEEDDEDIVAKVLKRYGLKFVLSFSLPWFHFSASTISTTLFQKEKMKIRKISFQVFKIICLYMKYRSTDFNFSKTS